jgi:hypothetical protein
VNQFYAPKGLTPDPLIFTEYLDEEWVDRYLHHPLKGLLAWYMCVVMADFCVIWGLQSNFAGDLEVLVRNSQCFEGKFCLHLQVFQSKNGCLTCNMKVMPLFETS